MPPKRKNANIRMPRKQASTARTSSDEPERPRDLDFISTCASKFTQTDIEALNVTFTPAESEDNVIPEPPHDPSLDDIENYVFPDINRDVLSKKSFDVDDMETDDRDVLTFFNELHEVIMNEEATVGTLTDSLVDDLLRIVGLNKWPLQIRFRPMTKLFITSEPWVSAEPEFVVSKRKIAMLVVEDKHLKNVYVRNGYGEAQLAAEILACADENQRMANQEDEEQTLYAIRVISTYVTFYTTQISPKYWDELQKGLPENQSVEILRWPGDNNTRSNGVDLAEPDGRRQVLTALVKLRENFQYV